MVTLPIGDVLSEAIIIERKRADDLVGSVQDGRIFNQALNMATSEMVPFLIVVGTVEEWMPAWNKYSNYKVNVDSSLVYSAFASLSTKYGVNCIWVPDDVSFCNVSLKIFEYQAEHKVAVPNKIQMMVKNRDKRIDYLKLLYGIAEKPARAVLAKGGNSLWGVMNLKPSELIDIAGIGQLTADKIARINMEERKSG